MVEFSFKYLNTWFWMFTFNLFQSIADLEKFWNVLETINNESCQTNNSNGSREENNPEIPAANVSVV